MKWNHMLFALGFSLVLTAGQAAAQVYHPPGHGHHHPWYPHCPYKPPVIVEPDKDKKEEPKVEPQPMPDMTPMGTDMVSQAPLGGTTGGPTSFPTIFGDAFSSDRGVSLVAVSPGATGFTDPSYAGEIGISPSAFPNSTLINVPNPSSGVVGRTQLVENITPIPTDRVFLQYDYFNNATIAPFDVDVQRYVLGVEKTFLGGLASVEIRLPWAQTHDNRINSEAGFQNRDTELGNLFVNTKVLLYNQGNFGLSGGLAVALPTANDTRVFNGNGTEIVRIDNETYIFTPYMAAFWTNSRAFAQFWTSMDFDFCGNTVLVAQENAYGLTGIGRLNQQDLLQLDLQLGYWLIQNTGNAMLRGVAPFIEVHYSTTTTEQDSVAFGGATNITDFAGNIDEWNVTSGVLVAVGDTSSFMAGLVIPIHEDFNRSFEYQVGFRANIRFGPSAATSPFGVPTGF